MKNKLTPPKQEVMDHFAEVINRNIEKIKQDNETVLVKALEDIIKHQETVGGGLAKISKTCHIARKALVRIGILT